MSEFKRTTDGITYHQQLGTSTIWKVSRETRKAFKKERAKLCVRVTRHYVFGIGGKGKISCGFDLGIYNPLDLLLTS